MQNRHTKAARRRVSPRREAGLIDPHASFWRGERAEHHIAARSLEYTEAAAGKAAKRQSRRSSGAADDRLPRVRTASSQLKRLQRALARRKTHEARVRVQAQIDALTAQLDNERWQVAGAAAQAAGPMKL